MIEIKEITPNETHLILPVIHRTTLKSYSTFYHQEAIEYFLSYHSKENVSNDIANGTTICLIEKSTIVGTGTLCSSIIKRVFVLPEYQNLGIGTKIMDYLESKARLANLDYLYLHASLPAKRFYDDKGYKSLMFSSIPVNNNITLDFYYMAKMLKPISANPKWNLNQLCFKVVKNEGPGAEVNLETTFTFNQTDEMVIGKYSGGEVTEGELIGYIENDFLIYRYEQTNLAGAISYGISRNVLSRTENGKIRLVDSWEWKSRHGKGHCILEEE